jgi:hypothetical protein
MRIISSGSAIDREALAADYAFVDAAGQHGLEQAAKQVAVAEATMAVFGRRRKSASGKAFRAASSTASRPRIALLAPSVCSRW